MNFSKSLPKIVVTDITWDVDTEEALEMLDNMTDEEAAKALSFPREIYSDMTKEESHDYALDAWHHNRVDICEFVGLPDKVLISVDPDGDGWDIDDISEYLSDEYGYCHDGFRVGFSANGSYINEIEIINRKLEIEDIEEDAAKCGETLSSELKEELKGLKKLLTVAEQAQEFNMQWHESDSERDDR